MIPDNIDIAAKLTLAFRPILLEYLHPFEQIEEGEDPIRVQVFRQFALGENSRLTFRSHLGGTLTINLYPSHEPLKMIVSISDNMGNGKVWYFCTNAAARNGFDVIGRGSA